MNSSYLRLFECCRAAYLWLLFLASSPALTLVTLQHNSLYQLHSQVAAGRFKIHHDVNLLSNRTRGTLENSALRVTRR